MVFPNSPYFSKLSIILQYLVKSNLAFNAVIPKWGKECQNRISRKLLLNYTVHSLLLWLGNRSMWSTAHELPWCGPRVQAQTKIRHWFHTFDRKMKNSEPHSKLKTSFKKRNKNSKTLEQNSSMKPKSVDSQVAHKFQDHLYYIHRWMEGHPHHQLYHCHLYPQELLLSSNTFTSIKWYTIPNTQVNSTPCSIFKF